MSLEIPEELIIEGVARAMSRWLEADPRRGERLLEKIAELQSEPMTAQEAAKFLGVAKKTLRLNHVEWGIDKSVALGPNEPRYFRSQLCAALKADGKVIKGREPRGAERGARNGTVTDFPTSTPAKKAS